MHLLGVVHHSPINPRALHEVVSAVAPIGAIALEQSESLKRQLCDAAGSPLIEKVLERMMAAPIEGAAQAHSLLSTGDLGDWQRGVNSAGLGFGCLEDQLDHFLLARAVGSDQLAGAREGVTRSERRAGEGTRNHSSELWPRPRSPRTSPPNPHFPAAFHSLLITQRHALPTSCVCPWP